MPTWAWIMLAGVALAIVSWLFIVIGSLRAIRHDNFDRVIGRSIPGMVGMAIGALLLACGFILFLVDLVQ